jgi:very-long-chain (3R)-3-hydroxyacyl-CoA dehydratase
MQVASRLFLMWAICWPFPDLNGSVFYSSMLVAWSLTEVIRYSSYALKQVDAVPGFLNWLRYSAFLVLYPVGISSEVAMTLQALFGPASGLAVWYPYGLVLVLLTYIPGEYLPAPDGRGVGDRRGLWLTLCGMQARSFSTPTCSSSGGSTSGPARPRRRRRSNGLRGKNAIPRSSNFDMAEIAFV